MWLSGWTTTLPPGLCAGLRFLGAGSAAWSQIGQMSSGQVNSLVSPVFDHQGGTWRKMCGACLMRKWLSFLLVFEEPIKEENLVMSLCSYLTSQKKLCSLILRHTKTVMLGIFNIYQ